MESSQQPGNQYRWPRRLFWIGVAVMTGGIWSLASPGWAALFAGAVISVIGVAGIAGAPDTEKKPLSKNRAAR